MCVTKVKKKKKISRTNFPGENITKNLHKVIIKYIYMYISPLGEQKQNKINIIRLIIVKEHCFYPR